MAGYLYLHRLELRSRYLRSAFKAGSGGNYIVLTFDGKLGRTNTFGIRLFSKKAVAFSRGESCKIKEHVDQNSKT